MTAVEKQTNTINNLNQDADVYTNPVGVFNALPAALVGKIAEFLPNFQGALPTVNREWNIGIKSLKSRFAKKDKENLDFIAVFQALSRSRTRVRVYLQEHPITAAQLRDKREVENIVEEIRTWMRANPNYGRFDQTKEPCLDLSNKKLHTLPPFLASLSDCTDVDLSHNYFSDLSFVKQLPPNVQCVKFDSNPIKRSIKVAFFLQKTLLVLTTAAAILCVIPPIRFIGSLILRSLSCLSSTLIVKNSLEHEGRFTTVLKCVKLATAILGLVGLILAQPYLIVGALAADIALQLFDCIRGVFQGNSNKALVHLSCAVLNGLVLAALVTGLWPIVIVAAALSAAFMLAMAFHAGVGRHYLDGICHLILMGVGIAGALASAEMKYIDNYHYEYTNNRDDKVQLSDYQGHKWTLAPGESITLDLPTQLRIKLPFENYFSDRTVDPVSVHETIVQQPIPYSDFPTLPVGSPYVENASIPFKPWTRP